MKSLFWNTEEHRVRSFWRLLLQGLLLLVLAGILTTVTTVAAIGVAVARGSLIPNPGDPRFAQKVNELIAVDPLTSALIMVMMLLSTFVSVWLAGRLLDHRSLADFGFHLNRRWWADLGFGLALGAVLMAGIFLVELVAGWVTVTGTCQSLRGAFSVAIWLAIVRFLSVGIQEEMFSRGYLLRNLAEGLNLRSVGPRLALLSGYAVSSIIFGLLHMGNPNTTVVSTINLIAAGLFLGLGYVLTGELAIPIGLHITWNFFQGNVFGFPVSGMALGTSFVAIQQGGPTAWTGGAFGPEAGLLGLLAMVTGSLLTVAWVRQRHGEAELQTHLAQYSYGSSTED